MVRRIAIRLRSVAAALLLAVAITAPAWAQETTRWTFLIFKAADNDLEPQAMAELLELEAGMPESGVEVIVFVDRAAANNGRLGAWSGGRLYRMRPGGDRRALKAELLREFGPVNTGDKALLAGVVGDVFKAYPAEHRALVLWNHGQGWASLALDQGVPGSPGRVASLSLAQVGEAVGDGLARAGIDKLDLFGFVMCLMGQLEAVAELRDHARILIASQSVEPSTGWAYDRFLKDAGAAGASPAAIAKRIVDTYAEANASVDGRLSTLAAIDLERGGALLAAFDALVAAIEPLAASQAGAMAQAMFWAESFAIDGRIADADTSSRDRAAA